MCLYGLPDGTWAVDLPAEEVPPEIPEPALGINFARDGMQVCVGGWVACCCAAADPQQQQQQHEQGLPHDASTQRSSAVAGGVQAATLCQPRRGAVLTRIILHTLRAALLCPCGAGLQRKDWLALVAVHSDSWLLALAFYKGARLNKDQRCGWGREMGGCRQLHGSHPAHLRRPQPPTMSLSCSCCSCRDELFVLINSLPTCYEVVSGKVKDVGAGGPPRKGGAAKRQQGRATVSSSCLAVVVQACTAGGLSA